MKTVFRKIWAALTSLKLAVMLILILAFFQVVGSIIPQNMDPEYYADAWSRGTYDTLEALGLLNVFGSPLFLVPALLLGLNVGCCAANIVSRFFTKKATHRDFVSALYHLTMLAMFAGFFTTFLVSFGGELTLAPGDETSVPLKWSETNYNRLAGGLGLPVPPDADSDFKIRLRSFDTTNVEMGGELFVKDWVSSLEVIEKGVTVYVKDVEVNDPMVWRGLKFYQASYEQRITFEVDGRDVETKARDRIMLGGREWKVRPVRHGVLLSGESPAPITPYVELEPPEGEKARFEQGKVENIDGSKVRFVKFAESSVLTYKRDPAVKYLWVLWMIFTGLIAVRVYIQEPYRRWVKKER